MMKVSIILPAYNAEKTISESIQSIIDQTYKDWELIIINDGSTDKTKELVLSFTDKRIRFFDNPQNKGLVYTLNRALSIAQGLYIARMDSDDISLPTRIERQIDYIEKFNLDLIGCMTERIDMEGNCVLPLANKSYSPSIITRCVKYDNCIAHPTWFGRKAMFEELGGYRNFHACEDYDFLLRAIHHNYKLGICDSIQLRYRENLNGISFSNLFKQRLSSKYLRDNINSIDSITEEDLNSYLQLYNTPEQETKYIKGLKLFEDGVNSLRHKKFSGLILIFRSIFISRYVGVRFTNLVKIQLIRIL